MLAINYVAVVGAAVAAFILGWLWYGPVFGKAWMGMMGYTKESMKSMKMTMGTAMTLGFISTLVMSYVLARFMAVWHVADVMGAFKLTIQIWLGFIATVTLGSVLWENRAPKLFFFNVIYQFVALYVMALVLVLWK